MAVTNPIANYLPYKVADYTAKVFDFWPEDTLPEEGDRNQVVHRYDDGSIRVVTLADQSSFEYKWQWALCTDSEAAELIDLWHDPDKANGRAKTWYWQYPLSDHIYVIRFLSPPIRVAKSGFVGYFGIPAFSVNVEGVKE